MTEIDEVAHLETDWDDRPFADLGLARVYNDGDTALRIEGRDDQGLPWKMWIPKVGGIGGTRVFRADFDRNGRPDLLFSSVFMGNGRCVEGGSITTLLFESDGRPAPWRMSSHGLTNDDSIPVILLDLDLDGQAEIVTSDCTYSSARERGMGEDRWLSGVYEARDARWVPIRPFSLDTYAAVVKDRFADLGWQGIYWEPTPDEWLGPLAGWDAETSLRITGLLTAELGCGAVMVIDGECTESDTSARLRYSDGKVRAGWPWVVLDSDQGREIHMDDPREAIETLLLTGSPLRLLGPADKPALLWAEVQSGADKAPLSARLAVTSSESAPIELTQEQADEAPADVEVEIAVPQSAQRQNEEQSPSRSQRFASFLLGGVVTGAQLPQEPTRRYGTRFSRDGRCFFSPGAAGGETRVDVLAGCQDLDLLESVALQGERVWARAFDDQPRSLSPSERRVWIVPTLGQWAGRGYDIEFLPSQERNGEVVGVAYLYRGWLAQWQNGLDTWLVLHSRTGEPLSPPISFEIDGELFDAGSRKGLIFLRWQDGAPVEMTTVRGTIEWVGSN